MSQISRRDFLKLARNGFLYLSGALTFGGLLRFLSYAPAPEQKTEFDLGSVDQYPLARAHPLQRFPRFSSTPKADSPS